MLQNTVIVKAFQGEPLKRVVVESNATRASVADPSTLERIAAGETIPISLPRSDIFQFDKSVYDRLVSEWKTNGKTSPQTWRSLKAWAG